MSALKQREDAITWTITEVHELDAASDALAKGQASAAATRLARFRAQALEHALGVPVSLAARLLKVSEPTVRDWADRGLLTDLNAKPRAVSIESVLHVEELLQGVRRHGSSADVRRALLARIDDALTLREPRIKRSLAEMRKGTAKHYVHRKTS